MKTKEILKLTIKDLADILNVSVECIRLYKKKDILKDELFNCGYKLLNISNDWRQIYTLERFEQHEKEINNNENYIIIDKKLKQGKKTNWKNSIGTHLIGKYKGIDFDFEIVDYNTNNCVLTILHNGKEKRIYAGDMARFKGFDILLGIKTYEFKYEIGQHILDYNEDGSIKRDLTIIDRKKDKDKSSHTWRYYKIHCNKCGFDGCEHYIKGKYVNEYWIRENHIEEGSGCGCCSGQFCVTGINDMWTTNPKLANLLYNKEDGYKYMQHTGNKLQFKCQFCNEKYMLLPKDINNYKIPCNCNDNISYPEKFMYSLLKQLNIKFTWQYTKTCCKWIKDSRRYDFYFELNNNKYIIETHGMQHYEKSHMQRTLEEEQENDKIKKDLALSNGIKEENYIVIDCRKSELEYIKNNIINSKLNEIFDLSKINWNKCCEYACKNVYKDICNEWNLLEDSCKSASGLARKINLGEMLVKTALKKGNELGWCDYIGKVNHKNDIYLKVLDLNDNFLGVYRGYRDLQNSSEEQFNVILNHKFLWNFIEKVNTDTHGNIKIIKTTKEEYYKNINIRIKYLFKEKYIKMVYHNNIYYFENASKCAEYINYYYNKHTSSSTLSQIANNNGNYNNEFNLSYVYLTNEEFDSLNSYNL